jgi:hypothetical protein
VFSETGETADFLEDGETSAGKKEAGNGKIG